VATNEISNETLLTNEISNETLDEMFNRGLNIHDDLEICEECQNSETFQHKVKKGILILEDATRLVSVLDIFSRNETVSEVPTEHLKFFLLPMLLGSLNSKITGGDRSETIKIVETYYEDFLQRIKDYGIASVPNLKQDPEAPKSSDKKPNVAQINRERDEKIRRKSKILPDINLFTCESFRLFHD
jgi:immunoglobulin-binding protein 1